MILAATFLAIAWIFLFILSFGLGQSAARGDQMLARALAAERRREARREWPSARRAA
jgi:hypothetical protein